MALVRYKPINMQAEWSRRLENAYIHVLRDKVFSSYTPITLNARKLVTNTSISEVNRELLEDTGKELDRELKRLIDESILYYTAGVMRVKRPTSARVSKWLNERYKVEGDRVTGIEQKAVNYAMQLKNYVESNAKEYIEYLSSEEVQKLIDDVDVEKEAEDIVIGFDKAYEDSIGVKSASLDDGYIKHMYENYINNVKRSMQGVGSYELARFRTEGARILEYGTPKEFESYVRNRFAGSVTEQRIRFRIKQETALFNVARESYNLPKDGKSWYIWKTKGDNRVRPDHVKLEGRLCSWNDPPLIDSRYGIYGHPSESWNCYSKDTEVYTKDGFKPIKDVTIGESILTLNPTTKDLEWSLCTGAIQKFCKNIVHFYNTTFELKVDPDHTFFTYKDVEHGKGLWRKGLGKIWYTREPRFVTGFKKLSCSYSFYKSSEWVGNSKSTIKIGDLRIPTKDFCILMGYYLSEGSTDNRDNYSGIKIAQSKYLDKMYDDLAFFNPKKGKDAIWIFNKTLKNYLRKIGYSYQKYIPEEIKELDKDYIRIFLDAFALGDGTPATYNTFMGKKVRVYNCYRTSSKKMADDLAECIIKVGMGASMYFRELKGKSITFGNGTYTINTNLYTIHEIKTIYQSAKCSTKIELIPYNDTVYDIEVEKNHTLLIKTGKCIHWNGNCRCEAIPVEDSFMQGKTSV